MFHGVVANISDVLFGSPSSSLDETYKVLNLYFIYN